MKENLDRTEDRLMRNPLQWAAIKDLKRRAGTSVEMAKQGIGGNVPTLYFLMEGTRTLNKGYVRLFAIHDNQLWELTGLLSQAMPDLEVREHRGRKWLFVKSHSGLSWSTIVARAMADAQDIPRVWADSAFSCYHL